MLSAIDTLPIVAILRGVQPEEIVEVAGALVEAGIRCIEVPLNSPDPFTSLRHLCSAYAATCLCGAGTVTVPTQVDQVRDAGGSLIVSPNTDASVIARAVELGLTVLPGFATATEAFTAIAAGARHLKLFPAATYGTEHLKALRAVLPNTTRIFAVGGIGLHTIAPWRRAGADGFGIGGDLYRPGQTAQETARQASAIVAAYRSSMTGT